MRLVRSGAAIMVAAGLLFMVSATKAEAVSVTYQTGACFSGVACDPPPGGAFTTSGGAFIQYNPRENPVTFDAPSTVSLGKFAIAADPNGGTFGSVPFDLFIVQTIPGFGVGDLTASINGKITLTSSGAEVSFSVPSVTLAGVQYSLTKNPLHLPAPSTGDGGVSEVSVEADVTFVPEPATMTLFGAALIGLAARKRRKTQVGLPA